MLRCLEVGQLWPWILVLPSVEKDAGPERARDLETLGVSLEVVYYFDPIGL